MSTQPLDWHPSNVDLHCHSTASDGKLSPHELIDRAAERGLQVLAITDHDTVSGYSAVREYGKQRGIVLVSGVELSCVWGGATIHVLGLNLDVQHPDMVEAIAAQKQARHERSLLIAERVGKKVKHEFDFARLREIAGNSEISRPVFAQYMVDAQLVSSIGVAFSKYLGAGKVGDVKGCWPTLSEVTGWVVAAGGSAVIAHAHLYKMTRTKLRACLQDFIEYGGTGIEVAYGLMDNQQRGEMVRVAKEMSLLGSIGSDFHGPNRFGLDLGVASKYPTEIPPVWSSWSHIKGIEA